LLPREEKKQNPLDQGDFKCIKNLREIKERFCETDKLIISEHTTTRALITDNRMHDLEDKLNQARLEASQLSQTNALIAALSSNGPGNSSK